MLTKPELLLKSWNQPNQNFATGFDKRTSDKGLLEIIYGSYLNAERNQWKNAGRALVDKTYLKMLWHSYGDLTSEPDYTLMSQHLDNLFRGDFPLRLNNLKSQNTIPELTTFVDETSVQLELSDQVQNISWLLFFLCPELNIIPINKSTANWKDTFQLKLTDFQKSKTSINPTAFLGSSTDDIDTMLTTSNWLDRRAYLL